jgi:chemotaxis protein MotB
MNGRNVWMRWALLVAAAVMLGGVGGCNQNIKKENEALWKENKELHDELAASRQALEAANMDRAKLQQELADAQRSRTETGRGTGFEGLAGEGVDVSRRGSDIIVNVAGDVLFDSGQATLKSSAKAKLSQIASALKNDPSQAIRVEGHTDSDPIRKSKWRDNYQLSEARATAVRDYLASQGIERARMSIVGHGPDSPVASNASRTEKARNRRVEIIVETR